MTAHDMLNVLEEGLKNGRISPHLAAYIAGEILDVDPYETDYANWVDVSNEEEENVVVTA
jgi:hypothetical protein